MSKYTTSVQGSSNDSNVVKKPVWEVKSKVGAYAEYIRTRVNELIDFIKSNKTINREFQLSIILDNRIHPVYNDVIKISEYINSINIFKIDESEVQKLESIAIELDKIYNYIENIFKNPTPDPNEPLLDPS